MQMLGARGTGAPRRGQMWGGRRAGAAVCVAAAAVTPGTPKAGQATGPRGAGSGRRALLAGPEQAGLTLPTPPPSSRPRLPTAMPTGPGGRGRPGGEHEMRPATAEARSGPAPDLSPLSPDARAGRGRCQGGLWVAPCGWAGAAGARGRGPGQPGGPAEAGRGAERGRGPSRSRGLPAVRDRESLRTQVSPQPQQHKMADTSPRRSRDGALAPPRRGPAPGAARPRPQPRPASLPVGPASLPRHPSLPPPPAPLPPRHAPARAPDVGLAGAGRRPGAGPCRSPGPPARRGFLPVLAGGGLGVQRWARAKQPVWLTVLGAPSRARSQFRKFCPV